MTPKKEDQSDEEIRLRLMRERAERAEQELRSAREISYLAVKMKLEAQEDADRRVAAEREAILSIVENREECEQPSEECCCYWVCNKIVEVIRARGKV